MRVDGYVRVSQVAGRSGERFISPAVQLEQVELWARANGALIGEMFEELDESGARRDRPMLLEAVRRVECGESDGVVVAKLDRFGRSLIDSLAAIERIQAAGGTFVSVQDGLDLHTDTGRLVLRIMFSMAEWELDRIRSVWAVARARAIARGVHTGAVAPVGYRRREDGRLVPDPETAPVIREVFRMRANRVSQREIGRFLEQRGVLTPWGNPGWCASSVARIFTKRTYLGEVRSGEFVNRDAHEPLVDAAAWQRAQNVAELRPPRADRAPSLLAGLLRCAGCRCTLRAARCWVGGCPFRTYHCRGHTSGGDCPASAHIAGSVIEPYVEAVFWQQLARRRVRPARTAAVRRLEESVQSAETSLAAYRDNPRIIAAIGAERFVAERQRNERPALPSPRELEVRWPSMSVSDRRAGIAEVIDCVFVERGSLEPEKRSFVCLRGEAPVDLPTGASRGHVPRPFDPSECRRPNGATVRARSSPQPWPRARVRRELETFVREHGHETFPTFEQFQEASRARLHAEILLQGGCQRWAREIGIAYRPHARTMHSWTEERVRRELAEFLDAWKAWPPVVTARPQHRRSRAKQAGRAG